jgi:hypothetical protein
MSKKIKIKDVQQYVMDNERMRKILFRESTLQNRLIKVLVVMNLDGCKYNVGPSSSFITALSKGSAIKDYLFPQQVHMTVFYKPSIMLRNCIKLAKVFFSKRTMDKWRYCAGSGSSTKCPFMSKIDVSLWLDVGRLDESVEERI